MKKRFFIFFFFPFLLFAKSPKTPFPSSSMPFHIKMAETAWQSGGLFLFVNRFGNGILITKEAPAEFPKGGNFQPIFRVTPIDSNSWLIKKSGSYLGVSLKNRDTLITTEGFSEKEVLSNLTDKSLPFYKYTEWRLLR